MGLRGHAWRHFKDDALYFCDAHQRLMTPDARKYSLLRHASKVSAYAIVKCLKWPHMVVNKKKWKHGSCFIQINGGSDDLSDVQAVMSMNLSMYANVSRTKTQKEIILLDEKINVRRWERYAKYSGSKNIDERLSIWHRDGLLRNLLIDIMCDGVLLPRPLIAAQYNFKLFLSCYLTMTIFQNETTLYDRRS